MSDMTGLVEFIKLVEQKTFTATARALGVSVSHVSRHVAALEARLNAQLFVRTTRQTQLTEAGERLFAMCQPLLEDLERVQESFLEAQDLLEGTVRISLAGRFAERHVAPWLAAFCRLHVGIKIEVEVSNQNVDLVGEGVHLAVRAGPLTDSATLVCRLLSSGPSVLMASAEFMKSLPPVRTPADLDPSWCLRLGNRDWHLSDGLQHLVVTPQGRFTSNSGTVMMVAVKSGLGIAQLPAYYAPAHERHGLVELCPRWSGAADFSFYLVYATGRHMPIRVRRLIDYMVANAAFMKDTW